MKWRKALKNILNKINKKLKILIVLILIAAIAGTVFVVLKNEQGMESVFDITPSYSRAFLGDISIDVYGDGNLESGYARKVEAETTISLDNVLIKEGTYVEEGQLIAKLDREKMQENLDALGEELNAFQQSISDSYRQTDAIYLKSPIDGRLKDLKVTQSEVDYDEVYTEDLMDE